MVLFLWKVSEGLVQGYDINFTECGRRGRMTLLKPYVRSAPAAVRRAREASLGVKGCKIFNLLPGYIRNIRGGSIDSFKHALDRFLVTIPDQPTVAGLTRSAESNSLIHQIPMKYAQEAVM